VINQVNRNRGTVNADLWLIPV